MTIFKEERLEEVHPALRKLVIAVSRQMPVFVVEGVRTLERQKQLLREKKTKTLASKHLKQNDGLGHAIDLVPCTEKGAINWKDVKAFRKLRTVVLEQAKILGIKVRHGADWNLDEVIDELQIPFYIKRFGRRPFVDYPHWELVD